MLALFFFFPLRLPSLPTDASRSAACSFPLPYGHIQAAGGGSPAKWRCGMDRPRALASSSSPATPMSPRFFLNSDKPRSSSFSFFSHAHATLVPPRMTSSTHFLGRSEPASCGNFPTWDVLAPGGLRTKHVEVGAVLSCPCLSSKPNRP